MYEYTLRHEKMLIWNQAQNNKWLFFHAVDVINSVYKATIATAQTTGSKQHTTWLNQEVQICIKSSHREIFR